MSLSVTEAVNRRISVRAFLPKPVPREAVVEILEAARRAPSGGNLQPWQVHVLGGEVLDEFRSLVAERRAAGVRKRRNTRCIRRICESRTGAYRFKTGEDRLSANA